MLDLSIDLTAILFLSCIILLLWRRRRGRSAVPLNASFQAGLLLFWCAAVFGLLGDPNVLGFAEAYAGTALMQKAGYLGGVILIGIGLVWRPATSNARLGVEKLWDEKQVAAMLEEAVEHMNEAFALYDENDRLVMMNRRYKAYYKEHADALVVGRTFEEMLRDGVARGQFVEAIGQEEQWVRARVESHQHPGQSLDQQLPDGRWIRVSESRTVSGYIVGLRVEVS